MPTKPKAVKEVNELTSAQILNAARNEIGGTYADQVPKALAPGDVREDGSVVTMQESIMSLRGIGEIMMEFQPLKNAFLSNLIDRIGRVIITSRLYRNPWAGFKKGILEYGETIEEIFVEIARPYQYDYTDTATNPFKQRRPDVQAAFHSMNYQKYYPTTVNNDQLRQAFLSWQGITDLISRVIEQLYTGANYDEFIVMKYMIAKLALKGDIYSVTIPAVTADNARAVTTQMVAQAKNLSFMSDKYNYAGVRTYTDPSSLYFILTTEIQSIFDVEVLALSFNMSKAELLGRQVSIDGFGVVDNARLTELFANDPYTDFTPFTDAEIEKLNSIAGLMVDVDWFMIYDKFVNMTEIYNPEQLYWNYFYHVWKIFSTSPFCNAILFTTESNTVTSVTVTPETATVTKGNTGTFTATITGTGFPSEKVVWSVTGGTASTIDEKGVLTVPTSETATTLTVTATSVADKTKTANATVTVA